MTTYGVYFAVLPAQPSIAPSTLKEACDNISLPFDLRWTHHREPSLVHPQLPEPLLFLEISGKLTTDRDAAYVCNEIVATLNQEDSIVGNAELLLILPNTPIPLMDLAMPEDESVETFEKYGLMAMGNAIENVDGLHDHAAATFERLYTAMASKPKKHFKEIMQRDENRFDFRLDLDDTWKEFEHKGRWKSLVAEILGEDYSVVKCGCVLSLPGASIQYFHSDGVHVGDSDGFESSSEATPPHALCVFVPLIDLDRSTGYTEFWAGSHRYSKLLQKKGTQALPGGHDGIIKKGDCLLYDYRTIHRGMPNTSNAHRPVCYFVYSKKGMEDVEDQNFEKESVFD
jgi:ectoine hydroxylase-related dioxygenase (phytanoyl-CoA dioxygenase family)